MILDCLQSPTDKTVYVVQGLFLKFETESIVCPLEESSALWVPVVHRTSKSAGARHPWQPCWHKPCSNIIYYFKVIILSNQFNSNSLFIMFIYQEYSKTVNIEDKVIIRDVVQECQANEDVIYSYDNSPIRIPYALTTKYYYDNCYFLILESLSGWKYYYCVHFSLTNLKNINSSSLLIWLSNSCSWCTSSPAVTRYLFTRDLMITMSW